MNNTFTDCHGEEWTKHLARDTFVLDGSTYTVSTINRESSCVYSSVYAETLVFKHGATFADSTIVWQGESCADSLRTHDLVVNNHDTIFEEGE